MPNPERIDNKPATIVATTTEQTLGLHGNREYSVAHDGQDDAGVVSADTIYMSIEAGVDASAAANADKIQLFPGRAVPLGPGASRVRFRASAGRPTFQIIPGGSFPRNA